LVHFLSVCVLDGPSIFFFFRRSHIASKRGHPFFLLLAHKGGFVTPWGPLFPFFPFRRLISALRRSASALFFQGRHSLYDFVLRIFFPLPRRPRKNCAVVPPFFPLPFFLPTLLSTYQGIGAYFCASFFFCRSFLFFSCHMEKDAALAASPLLFADSGSLSPKQGQCFDFVIFLPFWTRLNHVSPMPFPCCSIRPVSHMRQSPFFSDRWRN